LKETKIKKEGVVSEVLPNTSFRVILNEDNREVLTYISGKMRIHHIRILLGDRVIVEFSEYDNTKGRIVQRLK